MTSNVRLGCFQLALERVVLNTTLLRAGSEDYMLIRHRGFQEMISRQAVEDIRHITDAFMQHGSSDQILTNHSDSRKPNIHAYVE